VGNQAKVYAKGDCRNSNFDMKEIKNLSQYCRYNNLNIAHVHETFYGKDYNIKVIN
jgi:hypothetical protein